MVEREDVASPVASPGIKIMNTIKLNIEGYY